MDILIKDLNKKYKDLQLFQGFDLQLPGGKVTAVLGASGSGKTTLLHCIAGIMDYDGEIKYSGDLSYIFQNDRLIPSLTVRRNLEYVMRQKIADKTLRKEHCNKYLQYVNLTGAADKYPHELSGGMRQRVSMARAFCYPSQILLMDEPFKSLDIALKNQLLALFIRLLSKQMRTVVFVTHDISEAVLCADRIILLGNTPVDILLDCNITQDRAQRSELLLGGYYKGIIQDVTGILSEQLGGNI